MRAWIIIITSNFWTHGVVYYTPPPPRKKFWNKEEPSQHVVYCNLNFFHEQKNCLNVAFKRHRCKANCTTIAKSNKWNTIYVKQSSYLRCLSRKSTPMVFLYESVKFPLQNLWIIDDLPTPPSPTTTTFVWVVSLDCVWLGWNLEHNIVILSRLCLIWSELGTQYCKSRQNCHLHHAFKVILQRGRELLNKHHLRSYSLYLQTNCVSPTKNWLKAQGIGPVEGGGQLEGPYWCINHSTSGGRGVDWFLDCPVDAHWILSNPQILSL